MISRRRFIQSAAICSAVYGDMQAAGISLAKGVASEEGTDWIDAHVHVWNPDIKKYSLSEPYKQADMIPPSFTPDELFAHSRPQGVKRIVLIQMSFYGFDNQYMLDCMEKHTGVFSGVGIVDENHSGLADTMRSMFKRGVRGFRLYTDKQKASRWQESSGMREMWKLAADLGQSMCLLANPDALPFVNEMCDRNPKTRVVIDHFARIGVSGAIDPIALDDLCRLSKYENVFVKTSAFYALGQKKAPYTDLGPMVQRLVKEFGADRLMWASDCPYQVVEGHTYANSIGLIRDQLEFLTKNDKQWLLRGTAEKVFF